MTKTRAITFPVVSRNVRRNAETGIEIHKDADGYNVWVPRHPRYRDGRIGSESIIYSGFTAETLADAREEAAILVEAAREALVEAHAEALAEDEAIRDESRWSRSDILDAHAEALEENRVRRMLDAEAAGEPYAHEDALAIEASARPLSGLVARAAERTGAAAAERVVRPARDPLATSAIATWEPATDAEVDRMLKLARFHHDCVLVTPASIGRLLRRLADAEGSRRTPEDIAVAARDERALGEVAAVDAEATAMGPTPRAQAYYGALSRAWGDNLAERHRAALDHLHAEALATH